MYSVNEVFQAKYEVKKSVFLSFLSPIDGFEDLRADLKQKHPKANHIVYAYRTLNEFDQIVENSSDDGEPKGTSGIPSLNVLKGADLILCGVLIVRYFGGIKLGTGGLVRAYSASVQEVIKEANLIPYEKLFSVKFDVSYQLLQRFEHFFKTNSFLQYEKNFNETGANIEIKMSQTQIDIFNDFVKNFPHVKVEID